MNEEKTKFVKILTEYLANVNVSSITEVVYDIDTREVLEENDCGCYLGKRDPQKTWDTYWLFLDNEKLDSDTIYPTEEQYVNGWTIQYEVKHFLSCSENPSYVDDNRR